MRVLVIEDDKELREAVEDQLRLEGHETWGASDGIDGLRVLEAGECRPDIIVLDLMMPNMDGKLFRIRQLADPRFAAIPTLVVSAAAVDAETRSVLGAMPVLKKPFYIDALRAAIDAVIRPPATSKTCSCGRTYDAESWKTLRFRGEMDNGREVGERIELRQCECGTTLAWHIGSHAVSVPVARGV